MIQDKTTEVVDSIDAASTQIVDAFQSNVINQMQLLSESMQAASKVASLTSKLAVRAAVLEMVCKSAGRVATMIDRRPRSGDAWRDAGDLPPPRPGRRSQDANALP